MLAFVYVVLIYMLLAMQWSFVTFMTLEHNLVNAKDNVTKDHMVVAKNNMAMGYNHDAIHGIHYAYL